GTVPRYRNETTRFFSRGSVRRFAPHDSDLTSWPGGLPDAGGEVSSRPDDVPQSSRGAGRGSTSSYSQLSDWHRFPMILHDLGIFRLAGRRQRSVTLSQTSLARPRGMDCDTKVVRRAFLCWNTR